MVHEILLAIDPALKRIEEVLLWKNKVQTSIIFTCCNIALWLLYSFNIRTYCTISCILLVIHLLDTYRNKIRRKKMTSPSRSRSMIGKYITNAYDQGTLLYQQCSNLKKNNRTKYFLFMLVFWLSLAVLGAKVKGFYIAYCAFWIIFFIPAIVHYNVPSILLIKALPLLEQLDRSMEYQRRSVLDKKELLVDVKVPQTEIDEEGIEDEYLSPFRLDEKRAEKLRNRSQNVDGDDDDNDDGTSSTTCSTSQSHDFSGEDDDEEEEEEEIVEQVEETYIYKFDTTDTSLNSFLPNQTMMPSLSESDFGNNLDDDNDDAPIDNKQAKNLNVVKIRNTKIRPSLFDFYVKQPTTGAGTVSNNKHENDKDIDATFDFLDDEY